MEKQNQLLHFFGKKNTFLLAVMLLLSCLLVVGVVLTTFSGGESNKVFQFSGAGQQTAFVSLPLNANVTSASVNLRGDVNFDVNSFQDVNGEAKFDAGTYSNTDYNSLDSNGFVGLNLGNNSGDYNSQIFDATSVADWNKFVWSFSEVTCPSGMAFIAKLGGFCIDQYEASHSDASFCANSSAWTGTCSANYGTSAIPASAPDRIPWVSISLYDANIACAAAGKKLCNSAEWMAAANLNGQTCNLSNALTQTTCIVDSILYCLNHSASDGEACNTGSNNSTSPSNCKSSQGVFDLIGNVWEWTSDIVDVNTTSSNDAWQYPNNSQNPQLWGNPTPSLQYGNDGVYTSTTKTGRGVLRGGGWDDGSFAGLFCVGLSRAPTFTYYSVGFRCCVKP